MKTESSLSTHEAQQAKPERLKAYQAPQITSFGTVSELTMGTGALTPEQSGTRKDL